MAMETEETIFMFGLLAVLLFVTGFLVINPEPITALVAMTASPVPIGESSIPASFVVLAFIVIAVLVTASKKK